MRARVFSSDSGFQLLGDGLAPESCAPAGLPQADQVKAPEASSHLLTAWQVFLSSIVPVTYVLHRVSGCEQQGPPDLSQNWRFLMLACMIKT